MRLADIVAGVRAALTLPVAWAVGSGDRGLAFLLFAIAAASDLLDGWLARRGRRQPRGELLDPLADKVLVGGTVVALAVAKSVPFELAALVLVREGVVAAVRLAAYRAGTHHGAERFGKAKTALQFVSLGLLVAAHPEAPAHGPALALLWASALLGIATLPRYRVRG